MPPILSLSDTTSTAEVILGNVYTFHASRIQTQTRAQRDDDETNTDEVTFLEAFTSMNNDKSNDKSCSTTSVKYLQPVYSDMNDIDRSCIRL